MTATHSVISLVTLGLSFVCLGATSGVPSSGTYTVSEEHLYRIPATLLGDGYRSEILVTNNGTSLVRFNLNLLSALGSSIQPNVLVDLDSNRTEYAGAVWIELATGESARIQVSDIGEASFNQLFLYSFEQTSSNTFRSAPHPLNVAYKLSYISEGTAWASTHGVVSMGAPATQQFPFRRSLEGETTYLFLQIPRGWRSESVKVEGLDSAGKLLFNTSFNGFEGQTVAYNISDMLEGATATFGQLRLTNVPAYVSVSVFGLDPNGFLSIVPRAASPVPGPDPVCSTWIGTESEIFGVSNIIPTNPPVFSYTFLGVMSALPTNADSLANLRGTYGVASGNTIFNRAGLFGTSLGSRSPWDSTASDPPVIRIKGVAKGFLTRNTSKSPRLDPDVMLSCIGRTR